MAQTPAVQTPWPAAVFGPRGSQVTVWTRDGDEFEGIHDVVVVDADESATVGWLVLKQDGGARVSVPLSRISYATWEAPAVEAEAEQPPADTSGEDVTVLALPMHVGQRIRFAVATADGEEHVDGELVTVGRSPHPGHQRVVVARPPNADRAYNLADGLTVRVG